LHQALEIYVIHLKQRQQISQAYKINGQTVIFQVFKLWRCAVVEKVCDVSVEHMPLPSC